MGGPAYQEALVEILARQKRIATSAVEHFRVQELGAEYEKGRAAVIVRENGINLQGYEDLWQWCRSKRNMHSGWWPKQAVAWEYSQCLEYVDCWLFALACSEEECASVFTEGMPGTWWPVVVGLPFPVPQLGVFPFTCPALCKDSNKCWHAHVSRLVLRNGVRAPSSAQESSADGMQQLVMAFPSNSSEAPTECGNGPPPSSLAPSSSWAVPSTVSSYAMPSNAAPSSASSYDMPYSIAGYIVPSNSSCVMPTSAAPTSTSSEIVPSSAASSNSDTSGGFRPRRWGRRQRPRA